MPDYDPTSPKVSDDFIANDGESDVQGHIYKNEDDASTESRPEGIRAWAVPEESDDVEGHFRAFAAPEEDADAVLLRADDFRAKTAPEDGDDVEGHLGAVVAPDGLSSLGAPEDPESFAAMAVPPESDEFRQDF